MTYFIKANKYINIKILKVMELIKMKE